MQVKTKSANGPSQHPAATDKYATLFVLNILGFFSLSKFKPSLAKRKTIQLCFLAIALIGISALLNHRFYYFSDAYIFADDAMGGDQRVKATSSNQIESANPSIPRGEKSDNLKSVSDTDQQQIPRNRTTTIGHVSLPFLALKPKSPACAHFFSRMAAPGTHFLNSSGVSESGQTVNIPQRIFFVHYNKRLENPRYLCAAESAARQNPMHIVTLYVKNRMQFEASIARWRRVLGTQMSDRVVTRELDYADAFSETPLQGWWANRTYERSAWVDQNLGNAFRLSRLWKDGGVYLDMDIISLNPVGAMGRSIAMQDSKRMNNAYFSMRRYDPFMKTLMTEFTTTFDGYSWGHNGPEMVTRAYNKTCNNIARQETHFGCDGLTVAPTFRFFPVKFGERAWLFDHWNKKCNLLQKIADESVAIHWWNKMTHGAIMSNETTIAVIMQAACPSVFSAYTDEDLKIGPNGLVGEAAYIEDERKRPGI